MPSPGVVVRYERCVGTLTPLKVIVYFLLVIKYLHYVMYTFIYLRRYFFMNSIDRYILQILNIDSNSIASIDSYKSNNNIICHIKPISHLKHCPYCDNQNIISKGYRKLTLKTPTNNTTTCSIVYSIKRYQCNICHHSFSDKFNISLPNSRLPYATILKIMDLLKNPNMTFSLVAKLLSLSTQTVIRTFDNYFKIQHIHLPKSLCIDEVYTKNSDFYNSKYSCIFYDFNNKNIIDVTPSRSKSFLINYLEKNYSQHERDNVKFISIDMHQPYKDVINLLLKNAIICIDSLHIIKLLNDCVNHIIMRIIKLYNTSSIEYYLLKNGNFYYFLQILISTTNLNSTKF